MAKSLSACGLLLSLSIRMRLFAGVEVALLSAAKPRFFQIRSLENYPLKVDRKVPAGAMCLVKHAFDRTLKLAACTDEQPRRIAVISIASIAVVTWPA
jgi:hypothetical protein